MHTQGLCALHAVPERGLLVAALGGAGHPPRGPLCRERSPVAAEGHREPGEAEVQLQEGVMSQHLGLRLGKEA